MASITYTCIFLLFLLITQGYVYCSEATNDNLVYGNDSQYENVTELPDSYDELVILMEQQNQLLETLAHQQNVQNKILSGIANILQNHEQQLQNVSESMATLIDNTNTQNEMLNTMASSLERLEDREYEQVDLMAARLPAPLAKDCTEILYQGETTNYGIYTIKPEDDLMAFPVSCDLETEGNGWIVIQRRYDGSKDFYRGWEDYKNGFGDLRGEHWLGLEKVYQLTKSEKYRWQLRIDLEDFQGNTIFMVFDDFYLDGEEDNYRLSLGTRCRYSSGNGHPCMSLDPHIDEYFSTYDRDNDGADVNCAYNQRGGWWYYSSASCHTSNLNGPYLGSPVINARGMVWYHWKYSEEVLKRSEMKIARIL
ncbi:microfibril-associated glycoprotein 4-like [Amphiura filiformis]|uniref:microfibril-associated glycoprotein 4-like n=1 Tax=Amphiura filiformis TaxID=82378 RepID=UPI003B21F159